MKSYKFLIVVLLILSIGYCAASIDSSLQNSNLIRREQQEPGSTLLTNTDQLYQRLENRLQTIERVERERKKDLERQRQKRKERRKKQKEYLKKRKIDRAKMKKIQALKDLQDEIRHKYGYKAEKKYLQWLAGGGVLSFVGGCLTLEIATWVSTGGLNIAASMTLGGVVGLGCIGIGSLGIGGAGMLYLVIRKGEKRNEKECNIARCRIEEIMQKTDEDYLSEGDEELFQEEDGEDSEEDI